MIRLAYTQPHLREHLLPLLNRTANYFEGIDLFVRLTILEGNAGVPASSWSRNLKEGLRKAETFFGNVLEPQWYNPKGSFFIDMFRNFLTKKGFSPEDLEEAVSNLPLSTPFYRLGVRGRLEMTSFKHIMLEASKWAYRRSLSVRERSNKPIPLGWGQNPPCTSDLAEA